MKTLTRLTGLLFFLASCGNDSALLDEYASKKILGYEKFGPAISELKGRFEYKQVDAGPMLSNLSGKYGWLYLDLPISIIGNPDPNSLSHETISNISELQIVWLDLSNSSKKFVGEKVRVKGKLFSAHTAHHFSKVLLQVASVSNISVLRN